MGCFIGIEVPWELRTEILSFREQRGYASMEPHIKVISPALLENTPVIHQRLESFCLSQPEFSVTLGYPLANSNLVLYFPVDNDGVRNMRGNLLEHFQVKPTLANYRPHLTIVRQRGGMDMGRYLQEARETFAAPYTFTVAEAVLYTSQDGREYVPERKIAFTGRR